MSEKIKVLAFESLSEKWYDLEGTDWKEWTGACAFCEDCDATCPKCIINRLPICSAVIVCLKNKDKSPIIEALEDLVIFGELLPETYKKLRSIIDE